jgi:drug/metabolite transporter (DMT)-like permease
LQYRGRDRPQQGLEVLAGVTKKVLAWLALGIIWGATWLFIKIGLADVPPFTFAAIRFFIAAAPLLVLLRVRRTRLPRKRHDWILTVATGLLGFAVGYGLVYWGEQHISAGLTAILFTTYPLFGLVFAHFLVAGEPITLRRLVGVVLGIAGVALIFGEQLTLGSSGAVLGSVAVVVAAACAALSSVLIKARGGHLDAVFLTVAQILVGALPLLVAGLLLEGNPLSLRWTPMALVSLGYLAFFGSSLAFVIWYWLIRAIKVTTAQLLPFVNTLVAVVLGVVVLDEELGWRALAGGAAILLGLAVALAPNGRSPRAS